MQVKISARHGHLSEPAQQVIREKALKLLHYFDRLSMIEVTVDLHDDQTSVEVLASAEHKHDFVAREANGEVQVALDLALDKVVHQLRRYKEKIQDKRRTPSAGDVTGAPARTSADGTVYIDYKDTESLRKMVSGNGKILSRKRTGATAMEQRMLAKAVKRARYMALLPYVSSGF